ncbi:MAG: Methionine aminopeptidase, partial [uncultured Rubrobacteraceae bacterium]
ALSRRHDVHHRADDQRGDSRDTPSRRRLDCCDRRQEALRPVRAHHSGDFQRLRDPNALAPALAQDRKARL